MPSTHQILAQTTTTVPSQVDVVEPSRPISDWLIDIFDLNPDGATAEFLSSIAEPLFQIVVTIAIAWIVIYLARRVGRSFIARAKVTTHEGLPRDPGVAGRRNQRLEALGAVLDSILAIVVWATALLVVLGNTFGISIAPFLAGAGIIGIAVGFGAQDLVKDFVSGMFMLLEDQYAVGDVVDVGDATGLVERISLRTTRIRDVNGTVWHFPNGEIRRVGNLSQEWSRALLDISIAYGSDVDEASSVILEIAQDMSQEPSYRGLFLAPPEVWGVEAMAADAVVIRLVIKTLPGEQWAIARELRRRIKHAFDQHGIEIPFPQRTVWLRRGQEQPEPPTTDPASQPSVAEGKGAAEEAPG